MRETATGMPGREMVRNSSSPHRDARTKIAILVGW